MWLDRGLLCGHTLMIDGYFFLLCSVYLIFVQVEDCVIVPCRWTIAWYQNLLGEAVHLFPGCPESRSNHTEICINYNTVCPIA